MVGSATEISNSYGEEAPEPMVLWLALEHLRHSCFWAAPKPILQLGFGLGDVVA